MKPYNETQTGWILIYSFVSILAVLVIAFFYQWDNTPTTQLVLLIALAILVIIFLFFYGMKIHIDDFNIRITYGLGLARIKIKLDDIRDVRVVKNRWYYGLGIRFIPRGVLYNIHGLRAVELTFHSKNRIVRIGTNNPERLKHEIEMRIRKQF